MKTLLVNIRDASFSINDDEVLVVKSALGSPIEDFYYALGDEITAGVNINIDKTELIKRFVDEHPYESQNLLEQAKMLKTIVYGDNPNGIRNIEIAMPDGFFKWMSLNGDNSHAELYMAKFHNHNEKKAKYTIDVDLFYNDYVRLLVRDAKRQLKNNPDIEELVVNELFVSRRSDFVRAVLEGNDDVTFVPWEKYKMRWKKNPIKNNDSANEKSVTRVTENARKEKKTEVGESRLASPMVELSFFTVVQNDVYSEDDSDVDRSDQYIEIKLLSIQGEILYNTTVYDSEYHFCFREITNDDKDAIIVTGENTDRYGSKDRDLSFYYYITKREITRFERHWKYIWARTHEYEIQMQSLKLDDSKGMSNIDVDEDYENDRKIVKRTDGTLLYEIEDNNDDLRLFQPSFDKLPAIKFVNDTMNTIEIAYFDANGYHVIRNNLINTKIKNYDYYVFVSPTKYVVGDMNGESCLCDIAGNQLFACDGIGIFEKTLFTIKHLGIGYQESFLVYWKNGKCGVIDFEGNIILPAEYTDVKILH